MRLDLFLKQSRLVLRRTVAQQLCEAGAVTVNDAPAKSSREVRVGDKLSVKYHGKITTIRVLQLPTKQMPKSQTASLFEILGIETYEEDLFGE
ncbi:MAG: RNA-binding S4 domain-containing protein [Acidobacteriota bacterium]